MKNLVAIAVFAFISSSAFAQSNEIKQNNDKWQFENGTQPLFILDDKVITKDDLSSPNLDPTKIARIEVVKAKEAMEKYGEQGKNGVVIITSKEKITIHLDGPPRNFPEPLYVVDGKIMTLADFKIVGLGPDDIESIQVLKNKDATDQYGEKAKDGVILITTKKH